MPIVVEFWEEIEKIAAAANRESAIRVFDAIDGSEFPFLSNFSTSPFVVKRWGEEFVSPTVEHAYQAMKTDDRDEFEAIINAARPGIAKRFGRAVKDLRPDWETYKFEVMLLCLNRKFENVRLRANLLATGDALLVEGNVWHDNIWGDCHCARSSCQEPGKNFLGKFLMKLRTDLSGVNNA